MGGDGFKWRWDACIVPPNLAAEVLSKHLILPLVSTGHLAFTTKEPLGEMSESELEKVRAAETSARSTRLPDFFPCIGRGQSRTHRATWRGHTS